jgi:subtilisin family serine protease
MASKLNTVTVALIFALLTLPLYAEEQRIGPLDPSAGGSVTASLFPTTTCTGTHDLTVAFVPFTVQPQFAPVQWLNVPSSIKVDSNQSYIDVTIPLDKMAPGTYVGAVFYRCDKCDVGGNCAGQITSDFVRIEVVPPATFGASSADANFGGLVNGQPQSIHDLTVSVIGELKNSTFMQLTGAANVIETLEDKYADRQLTSNNLSDISFVKTVGTTDKNGRMSTQVQPIDEEDVLPGNGRYVLAGIPNAEEIYIGVDLSLKGITEARKHPDQYFVFTLDGQMGVISKADFVHALTHEGLHASLSGKYNTETKDGKSRGACLEEEVEGFRVGNAAARALGLPEDSTTPGANYGGGSNSNYPTQFPQLVPGQESTDPTRKPAPKTNTAPTKTSALPTQTLSNEGYCFMEGSSLRCEGTNPGFALSLDAAARATLPQISGLRAPCSFGASGWMCTTAPAAVAQCAGGTCKIEAAGAACEQDGKGVRCNAMPVYQLACTSPTSCTLSDPLAREGDEALATAANALYAATQSADCNRAGLGEFRILNPMGGLALPSNGGDDVLANVLAAFARDTTPGSPQQQFLFQFALAGRDAPSMTWPGAGSRTADVGSDTLPQRGVIGVGPSSTGLFSHGGFDYQLQGGNFGSMNIGAWLNDQAFDLYLKSRTRFGDTQYSTLLFDDYRQDSAVNALRAAGYSNFESNPCRNVLVPTDPNYKRTGRNGGNSWGEKRDDQWAIKRVGYTDDESSAWRLVLDKSAPVVVAVIDTGLDWHHADIDPASVWRNEDEIADNGVDDDKNGYVDDVIGWDFVADNNRPWDYDGHGTFVTGIIAAKHNEVGIAGISPNARIMVLKGVSNFGTTRASWLAEAVVYAVDNGAKILNLSVGGPHESKMEQAALEYARQQGVLVVAAAGNSGVELKDFGPGGHDSVLTVGATHVDDRAAEFSNFGDKVDLVAPGVDVLSLRARGTDVNYRPWQDDKYKLGAYVVGDDKRYEHASGTSFATPIVTATAALVLGNNPKLTGSELASILTQTAMDIEAPGRDPYAGNGMINPRAALAAAPNFHVAAEITRVELLPAGAPTAAQVWGTIDATQFKRAWVQMGPGENPGAWRFVGQKRKFPIRDGQLATIPLADFAPSGPWTIVVNVEDKNGVVKRGKYLVRIP